MKIFACGGRLSRRVAFKCASKALLQAANQRRRKIDKGPMGRLATTSYISRGRLMRAPWTMQSPLGVMFAPANRLGLAWSNLSEK
jgi:hypothetical protein